VTNKRTITTRVLVDDGGMIVLGGLIEDRLTESEQRVPGLGRIPIIGSLFRVRNTQKTKTNLMVFIRPRVVRTAEQAAIETNAKYNYLRNLQLEKKGGKVQLMPGESRPSLPPLIGPIAPPIAPAGSPPTPPPPPPDTAESAENPGG
jgi:general secretion pathway protein D